MKNPLEYWKIALQVLMLITSGVAVFSLTSYLRKYKIIQSFFLKIGKQTQAYNLLRREQLKKKLEDRVDFEAPKFSALEKVYFTIQQLGLLEKLPGFSEMHVILIYLVIIVALSCIVAAKTIIYGGLVFFVLAISTTRVICKAKIAQKTAKINEQLSLFVNACEGASSVHSDIIDIIGAIYDRMRPPLNTYLEECYLEAKITNNKQLAVQHLKNKTSSVQFRSIIDNLQICSEATGDYQKTIDDIRDPIRINQSFEKKRQAAVKNARVNILFMTIAGLAIVGIATLFLENAKAALFETRIGLSLLCVALLIMLRGLTIRARR